MSLLDNPDGSSRKVHIPYAPYFPTIGAPTQLPWAGHPVPLPIPPTQTAHAPVPLPPAGVFEPNGLPPWLQNPSTPGLPVSAKPPTIMPGVAVPIVTSPVTPATGGLLPEIGHDLADAGQKAAVGAIAGAVVIGGLLVAGAEAVGVTGP